MSTNDYQNDAQDYNRRDFLKGGSLATLMTMLGGVEVLAQTNAPAGTPSKEFKPPVKVAVIGLGAWGRTILDTLARNEQAVVEAICDNYPAFLRRAASLAPKATQTADYKTILANPEIKGVIIATATHQHKEIVLAALKAGKHVYCEAPIAHTMDDAREIALAAKALSKVQIFQGGYQLRADPQRLFLLPFIRSGQLGNGVMARAQWHKKTSWRAASPNPEREKAMNWRLYKTTSIGLLGEIGSHQIDEVGWFLNAHPKAVTGFSSLTLWNQDKGDDRDVPDTVQAVVEYPNGVNLIYQATLANSFDGAYEMLYGSGAAIMLREDKAWMFKEVDAPLFGWEVYCGKENFYKETGIVLKADASKSAQSTAEPTPDEVIKSSPLYAALGTFLWNTYDLSEKAANLKEQFGEVDAEEMAKVVRRPASGFQESYQATVTGIIANEAAVGGKRIEFKPEWLELK